MHPSRKSFTSLIISLAIFALGCSAGSFIVRAPLPTPTATKTPRITFTPTLIPTETSTPTETPSPTIAPTDTPAPVEAPEEAVVAPKAVVSSTTLNVRGGPGTNYSRIGRVGNGHTSDVLGKVGDASWVLINHDGGEGWVSTQYLQIEGNLDQVKVIDVKPPAAPAAPPVANNPPPPPPPTNTPAPAPTAVPSFPYPAVVTTHSTGGDVEFRISGFAWVGSSAGIGAAKPGLIMEVVTPSGEVKTSEVSVGPNAGDSTVRGAGDNHNMNFQFKTSPYIPGVYKVTLKENGTQVAPTVDVTAQAGPPFTYAHIDFIILQ